MSVAKAADLLQLLRPTGALWGDRPKDWIFRGQSDCSRLLIPLAYRDEAWLPFQVAGYPLHQPTHTYPEQIDRQEREELSLLRRFVYACDAAGLAIPEHMRVRELINLGTSNSEIFFADPAIQTLMALAQHHGIPTRLLDFTRNSLHAAYFAASSSATKFSIGKNGKLGVWAVSLAFLVYASSLSSHISTDPINLRIVTAPSATNANLRAQLGLFLLWWHNSKGMRTLDFKSSLEELKRLVASHLSKQPWVGHAFIKFELPWSESATLCRILADENINGARMFTGYDGVVRSLKEQAVWDRYLGPLGSSRDGFFFKHKRLE
ncbi:FRG domain-containing protein [Nitrosomonas supralitoralis]|uniref:FRG domain-containing protein n=1 Tax=Nitrosomonas supralitoralis TaxID=2116706 RepID=UPI0015584186|nr:FRG domain-containing protein [Nitrosomonas supralitoralis]